MTPDMLVRGVTLVFDIKRALGSIARESAVALITGETGIWVVSRNDHDDWCKDTFNLVTALDEASTVGHRAVLIFDLPYNLIINSRVHYSNRTIW